MTFASGQKNQPGGSRPADVTVSGLPASTYLAGAGALVSGAAGTVGVSSDLLHPARTNAATTLSNAIVRNDFFMVRKLALCGPKHKQIFQLTNRAASSRA